MPDVLVHLSLAGRAVTGDALYGRRAVCQQVMETGGEYLFMVKGNQTTLYEHIVLLFREPPGRGSVQRGVLRGQQSGCGDVTLGEDGCRVRMGRPLQVLAALPNVVLGLLRRRGVQNVEVVLRENGWQPWGALRLLGPVPASGGR